MNSLIRKCIKEIKDDLEGTCNKATPGSSDCLSCFQGQYFDGNVISYDCFHKIRIYVARFFPVHAKENAEAFNLLPSVYKRKILRQNPINIMSIGGGPGSDAFAVKNFLSHSERRGEIAEEKNVYLLRVDKEENWDDIAKVVHSKHLNTENIKYDLRKSLLDITKKNKWPKKINRSFNLFTMSYFISELCNEEEVEIVAEFINMYSSKNCSFLLINDRNDQKVRYFKNILFKNILCNTDYESEDCTKYHCGFFYDDDDRDLIGPKLNTNSIRFLKALYI